MLNGRIAVSRLFVIPRQRCHVLWSHGGQRLVHIQKLQDFTMRLMLPGNERTLHKSSQALSGSKRVIFAWNNLEFIFFLNRLVLSPYRILYLPRHFMLLSHFYYTIPDLACCITRLRCVLKASSYAVCGATRL